MIIINNNKKYYQSSKVSYINFENDFEKIAGFTYGNYLKAYMLIILLATKSEKPDIVSLLDDIEPYYKKLENPDDEDFVEITSEEVII